jgi:two-component system, chemotaxis family, protein-glutamate methylesterase/glutaminase
MIRVLIADDSATFRQLLGSVLAEDRELNVIAEASNGAEALELVEKHRPDLVIMDVHMPIMDGLEATKEIMIRCPTPIMIVSSAVDQRGVGMSLSATQAGALMALPKPTQLLAGGLEEFSRELCSMAKAMAQVKVVRRWVPSMTPARPPLPRPTRTPERVRLVAIGASTGGPAAIRRVLMDLPHDFPVPILVVQHIAHGFAAGFAEWLSGGSPLRVKLAVEGEAVEPATVYVAPDDRHLGISRGRVVLSDTPMVGGFRPSASFLFDSAAQATSGEMVAVILTGMGSDGVDGLRRVHEKGGVVIAQDEASSIVYGMAQEAVRSGVVHVSLPIDEIARELVLLVCKVPNGGR